MRSIFILILLFNFLNAMNCSDYKEFQLFNGHYYTISVDKLTFESAKQIAKNNGGYLAIPNSQAENDFIKKLIGGGSVGWIGVEDPNKIQNYCYGSNCIYDPSRFKDVKGNSLIYKNFHSQQPDNLVKQYDVVDGKQMVSPLGEHWVAIDGNNGKWFDDGNHADEYNNPVKYKAVFEFETLSECKPLTDDGIQELTGRFCNTKIWDSTIDTINLGQTSDCQTDKYGNEYCPSALSQCSQEWDYDNGFSVAGLGQVVDYAEKATNYYYIPANEKIIAKWYALNNMKYFPQDFISGTYWVKDGQPFGSWYWRGSKEDLCTYNGNFSKQGTIYYSIGEKVFADTNTDGLNVNLECRKYSTDYSCPIGTVLEGTQCKQTTYSCPIGYTETTGSETSKGECKKTIEYTYYNYLCNNSKNEQDFNYIAQNSGGNCNKTDSNNLIDNSSNLSQPCNSSTPPTNNCKREKFMCQINKDRPCSYVDNSWQCSPFPCMGQSNLESLDTQVGKDDKNNDGWSEDGSCPGTIYIFNGKSNKCRTWDMFFGLIGGGCCDKEKVFAGLVACKENEKILAKKREQKQTHYIGNFCSKELKLGFTKICVQKSDSYCTFSSSLAKIIQEQGREQLSISWGSAKSPECRGFTPEEFQKIDFSKIDLTEFVKDIQSSVQSSVIQNLGTYVKDKVGDFYGN